MGEIQEIERLSMVKKSSCIFNKAAKNSVDNLTETS